MKRIQKGLHILLLIVLLIPIMAPSLAMARNVEDAINVNGDDDRSVSQEVLNAVGQKGTNIPQGIPEGSAIIAYEGLLTKTFIEENACTISDNGPKIIEDAKPSEEAGKSLSGKVLGIVTSIIAAPIKLIADILFSTECASYGNKSANFSVVSQITNITKPLNLTNNAVVMKLTSIMQSLAYVVAIGLIVFYGVMYTTGYQNLNPVSFGIRVFFSLMFVYYLPYLIQDVLNINNIIVHNLNNITMTFDGSNGSASSTFAKAIHDFATALTGEDFLKNLLMLVIVIAMLYFSIAPLLKIIMWWYMRLLRIFFYSIIGPIIVVFMALPQTASMAVKWVRNMVGEIFSQLFMVLGTVMVSYILVNMKPFAEMVDLGWLGQIVLVYACIYFLASAADVSKEFIGGINAGDAGGAVKQLGKNAKFVGGQATNSGKATYAGMRGKEMGGKGANQIGAKIGQKVGGGVRKVGSKSPQVHAMRHAKNTAKEMNAARKAKGEARKAEYSKQGQHKLDTFVSYHTKGKATSTSMRQKARGDAATNNKFAEASGRNQERELNKFVGPNLESNDELKNRNKSGSGGPPDGPPPGGGGGPSGPPDPPGGGASSGGGDEGPMQHTNIQDFLNNRERVNQDGPVYDQLHKQGGNTNRQNKKQEASEQRKEDNQTRSKGLENKHFGNTNYTPSQRTVAYKNKKQSHLLRKKQRQNMQTPTFSERGLPKSRVTGEFEGRSDMRQQAINEKVDQNAKKEGYKPQEKPKQMSQEQQDVAVKKSIERHKKKINKRPPEIA
ncbi:hypothetical protein IMZ31_20930 (plasmid) [Pontibacillus sp. ALD_SL1]|uniref:hypothetical protein n=1 Tax=Pontibacillus sp. ALD_SL1 TaxID=2777185 RepID=UPI001A96A878|nr:hypothetical protein [Pontibacillus sp. ALD_SL1]QST03014.1 hypothetical protein IMZ31_20930 [Pontibacillus sp. ALD_SL1]